MKALEFDMERAYHSLARKENFVTGEVIEMLKQKVSSIPIRGFTKVELFDEKRFGKKVEEVTAENFISINMKDYLEYILMNEYSKIGVGLDGPNMMPLTYREFPFDVLALTTDSNPENPQNERVVMGDVIGYSFKKQYVGSDTRRGTLNSAESYKNSSMAHFVFDFATNAANGTFSSVVWYSDIGSTDITAQQYYQKNFEWYVELKGENGLTNNSDYCGGLCFDGSSFWTLESTGSGAKKIVEVLVTPGTNGKNATFTLGRVWDSHVSYYSDVVYDMTYDSDYIYYVVNPRAASFNTIYRVKKSDGTRSTITLSGFRYLYGIERVGAYFYVLGQSETQVNGVYPLRWAKYDSSLNIIEAKNIFDNDVGAYGMAYNQQKNEIAVRTDQGLFIFDLQMNRLSYPISQPNSPHVYPGIAVKDGEYFLRDEFSFFMAELGSLGARNLLPTPVTKTSTNTMKVTYDFMFV